MYCVAGCVGGVRVRDEARPTGSTETSSPAWEQ